MKLLFASERDITTNLNTDSSVLKSNIRNDAYQEFNLLLIWKRMTVCGERHSAVHQNSTATCAVEKLIFIDICLVKY